MWKKRPSSKKVRKNRRKKILRNLMRVTCYRTQPLIPSSTLSMRKKRPASNNLPSKSTQPSKTFSRKLIKEIGPIPKISVKLKNWSIAQYNILEEATILTSSSHLRGPCIKNRSKQDLMMNIAWATHLQTQQTQLLVSHQSVVSNRKPKSLFSRIQSKMVCTDQL